MNACISELKTRARLGLNSLAAGDHSLLTRVQAMTGLTIAVPQTWKLRHAFALVAQSVGFRTWEQARRVLEGCANLGDDMGTFWHAPRCSGLLNHWFANYHEASEFQLRSQALTLLTYREQFVVVDADYLSELGLGNSGPGRGGERFDAVSDYGNPTWLAMCVARLQAPESSWLR